MDVIDTAKYGVRQKDDPVLRRKTLPFRLPDESKCAEQLWDDLKEIIALLQHDYPFKKGVGLAAPQIGIGRRLAIVHPRDEDVLCLLNAEIVSESLECDRQFEGCLSFFDKRGSVDRPLRILVRAQGFDGIPWEREFTNGTARLICHEIDHLDGMLYLDRLGLEQQNLVTVEEYRRLRNTDWSYS